MKLSFFFINLNCLREANLKNKIPKISFKLFKKNIIKFDIFDFILEVLK